MKKARWIWKEHENEKNTWMCFIKDIVCESAPEMVTAKIAVDSKYWLYINGELVIFEGGLKRGPTPTATYCDEPDLSGRFVKGKNRIAILVCYFGKNGFCHVSSGRGGLYFDAVIGEERVVSDGSWKLRKHPAYVPAPIDDIGPNYRLPESDIYFDASKDIDGWYTPEYSAEEWEDAGVISEKDAECFGELYKRGIPMLRDYGLKPFVNTDDVKGRYIEEDTVLEMRLPYNLQFTPYLMLIAEAGKKIVIKAENYHTNAPGEKGIKSVYITKNGRQEYEALGWLNGEHISFEVPAGVKILDLKYRETGYDVDRTGSFVSDDEFLNKLWEKCYRTLYISMRDTFMDCPDRERTQWWGDVNVEMQMLLYCMDERASLLYEKGVESLVGWYRSTGNMWTVVPSGREQFELPFQNLSGIYGFTVYYDHKGDVRFLENVYEMSRDYVLRYETGDDGLVIHRSGSWDWPDWGKHADVVIMENAWYCLALSSCLKIAEELGLKDHAAVYAEKIESIRKNIKTKINSSGVFYGYTDNGIPDDRANALAVLAGFTPTENYDAVSELFKQVENASPYMEKYVLDAICAMGRVDEAVERMKKRYEGMVSFDYSTLWEHWGRSSSLNHAWSGGPLVTMSKYVAGISSADVGGNEYTIAPNPGELSRIECAVPTKKGILKVNIRRSGGEGNVSVIHPAGIRVTVTPPKEGSWTVNVTEQV